MTIKKTDLIDYRKFRLSKLSTPEFEHVKLLAFWPVYGLAFLTVERLWIRDSYTPISCALDSAIPFCELFLIPYLFWFVFLTGTLIYTFLCDAESFTRMMKFIIISYTAAIAVYILFPNCQELRPPEFARDNILTRFIARFYEFDTNTNVCPSIHVIGSVAAVCGAWDSKHFSPRLARVLRPLGVPHLRFHRIHKTALRPGPSRRGAPVPHRLAPCPRPRPRQ